MTAKYPNPDTPGRTWSAAVIAFLISAYVIILWVRQPMAPLMTPDSGSYLQFSPIRSLGYPLFLRLTGSEHLIPAQLLLYGAALAFLGRMIFATAGGLPAVTIVLTLMINPELNMFHYQMLTESAFLSLEIGFLAAIIGYVSRPSLNWLVLASVLAGVEMSIRPNGAALPPVLVLMVLWKRQTLRSGALPLMLAAAVLPFLAVAGAERLAWSAWHGNAATSLAGRHFFAKAGMIEAPPLATTETDPLRRRMLEALEQDFAPIRRLIEAAPEGDIRRALIVNYETCLEYYCAEAVRAESGLSEPALNRLALSVGLQRLSSAPIEYANLVFSHYCSMWVIGVLPPALFRFVETHRPLPFENGVPLSGAPVRSSWLALIVRPAFLAIGWLTGALAVAGLIGVSLAGGRQSFTPTPALQAACLAALSVHASFLLAAMVGIGIPRYTIGMWPAMMVALGLALSVGSAAWIRRKAFKPFISASLSG